MKSENRFPRKIIVAGVLIFGLLLCLLGVRACNSYRFYVEKQVRFMMDTYVTIYAVGPRRIVEPAVESALDRMQEIDRKMNPLNPESPLAAFNQRGVPINDPEILEVVRMSLEVSNNSGGAFDITAYPLSEVWGFSTYSEKSPHLPRKKEIKAALKRVGYNHLSLGKGILTKDDQSVAIDLGGIAKGYALSQAVKILEEKKVKSALIDAGGDVYALGRKGGKPWKVGIQSPREENLLGYVEAENRAVMGSGDYERFFIEDGKRYHHILDPETGYPAVGLSGITVFYADPVMADAWATALFVLGPEKGIDTVNAIAGMEAIFVTDSGQILYSSGLGPILKTVPETDRETGGS